jgi:hypothetical protein
VVGFEENRGAGGIFVRVAFCNRAWGGRVTQALEVVIAEQSS